MTVEGAVARLHHSLTLLESRIHSRVWELVAEVEHLKGERTRLNEEKQALEQEMLSLRQEKERGQTEGSSRLPGLFDITSPDSGVESSSTAERLRETVETARGALEAIIARVEATRAHEQRTGASHGTS